MAPGFAAGTCAAYLPCFDKFAALLLPVQSSLLQHSLLEDWKLMQTSADLAQACTRLRTWKSRPELQQRHFFFSQPHPTKTTPTCLKPQRTSI